MRVLAVDDQPEVLKQIEKAIAASKAPDGQPYQVVGVTDHKQAIALVNQEHFDVVVADLVMGPDREEGLAVLRELTQKSPITIVLTAYPSYRTCVAAMRAGAWDYLEKMPENGADPYGALLDSLQEAYRHRAAHPEAGRSNPDSKWVREHLDELLRDHAGEVIAVLDGKVVDHDASYGELAKRVRARFPVAHPTITSIPDSKVEAVE